MTQERLDEIKKAYEPDGYHPMQLDNEFATINELISALEEVQCIPDLIVQIFEAGGDLKELWYNSGEEIPFAVFNQRPPTGSSLKNKYFRNLISALEFILERTKE